jgi:hypothetical protein
VNRYALALLVLLFLAGLAACGSADSDPAQRVEKPVSVAASVPQEK